MQQIRQLASVLSSGPGTRVFPVSVAMRADRVLRYGSLHEKKASYIPPCRGDHRTGLSVAAVAGMGIASVIHHTAINTATAATLKPSGVIPSGSGKNRVIKNRAGPSSRPYTADCLRKVHLTAVIGNHHALIIIACHRNGNGMIQESLEDGS